MADKRGLGGIVLREQIAQEAARLIVDHGMHDYGQAKRKAVQRFGRRDLGTLPSNSEIESSVFERLRIFDSDFYAHRLIAMRRLAADIMELLGGFEPRLAGSVLTGTVTENTPLELHVFTDAPEDIFFKLTSLGISSRECERRYRIRGRNFKIIPGLYFTIEGERVYVIIFPEKGLRQAPISPVDRRPMQRAGRRKVLSLLEQSATNAR